MMKNMEMSKWKKMKMMKKSKKLLETKNQRMKIKNSMDKTLTSKRFCHQLMISIKKLSRDKTNLISASFLFKETTAHSKKQKIN
jgi:hypothetical protein